MVNECRNDNNESIIGVCLSIFKQHIPAYIETKLYRDLTTQPSTYSDKPQASPLLQKITDMSLETRNSAKLEICDPINSLTNDTLTRQPESKSKGLEAKDKDEK